jgi:histidine triad (HIT) family protein
VEVFMAEDCLFCRMGRGEIPVEKFVDEEHVFAIRDINPRAPVHALIIPKTHIPTVRDVTAAHEALLGRMFEAATRVATIEGVLAAGYRLAFNCGDDGGQTIYHIHMHLVGGRRLGPEG